MEMGTLEVVVMVSRLSTEDLARFAASVHEEPTTEATVEQILDFSRTAVGADHAGVMLVHGGKRIETIAATDAVVAEVDALQMKLGQGPDLEVLHGRETLVIPDIARETRWPEWAGQVADAGIRSLLSVRLSTSSQMVGTLNLYARRPNAFDVDDHAIAQLLARHAAVALAVRMKQEDLLEAVDARKRIGQAQGILMERYQLTAGDAFAVLRRYSQDNSMKLREVAEVLIETSSLPGEQ